MFDFDTPVRRTGIGNMKAALGRPGQIILAGAEMDFATAPSLIEAVVDRARNGLLGFTLADDRYLAAVRWWLGRVRGWEVERDWIVPTLGTIFALATAIRLLTREGDGIIVQPPVYHRFAQAARRLNRRVVTNPLILRGQRYEMDFEHLERCLADPRSRLLVLCHPHNPVARSWRPEELVEVARLARRYDVYVFSDEIFGDVTAEGHEAVPFAALPEAGPRVIVATSLGKTFNLTGVNHANVIIPDPDLRRAFIAQRNADHFGSIDPLFHAALCGAYSEEGLAWVQAMRRYVFANAAHVERRLQADLGSIRMFPVEGTFVGWIDFRSLGLGPDELFRFLSEEAAVRVDPGTDYGEEGAGFARINLATLRAVLDEALDRLAAAVRRRFPEQLHDGKGA